MNLDRLKDRHIEALMRVAKTRGRAFFAHPRMMMALREEYQKRCCNSHNGYVTYEHVHRQGGQNEDHALHQPLRP